MRIETKDGRLAAEYTDSWVFHSEELEERYDGLEVYGFIGAPKVDGVDIIEIGGKLPEDDYRFAYDLAGDDYVVSLNGSVEKGGPGSGNFGHAGRPGTRGGSASSAGLALSELPKGPRRGYVGVNFPVASSSVQSEVSQAMKRSGLGLMDTSEQSIQLDRVVATQKWVRKAAVRKYLKDPSELSEGGAIKVIKHKDRYYVEDGHHRLVAAKLLGMESVDSLVWDVDRTSKGGAGSGNFGHSGRPGQRGGSASGATGVAIDDAATFVKRLTLTGGDIGDIKLSQGARAFLAQTVTRDEYKLYRGIALVKGRISEQRMRDVRGMASGEEAPDYLAKTGNPYSSYTTKKSVARYYSEGKVSVIIEANVAKKNIVVDTRNLRKVLKAAGREDAFSSDDYDYFKSEAEVIVQEPISATILSSKSEAEKGGARSGYYGHAGRPGSVGGSSGLPGYVARTTAMKELGVKHASRMNQYFKYGMPSTSVGGRRYVKWPEAKEWMDQYAGAGKGTRGVEAANTAMRSRGIPVGKHPPLPPPPPPSKPVTGRYAMDQLGIKHYSRLHSYKKHGMPTMKDPKTGKEVIKWPEAKLWYETYDKAGKGRAGIDAANKAVNSSGAAVPKPPAPPKPPDVVPETPGKGKYEDVKVYVDSKTPVSNIDHVKIGGFDPMGVGTARKARESGVVKSSLRRLPQEHVDSIRGVESDTVSASNRRWGKGWGDNVAGWMERKGQMGLMYTDQGVRRWNRKTVVHEAGHGVFTSMMSFMGGRTKRQESARSFLGTPDDRKGKRARINKEYKAAKAGKKGAGFVTGYSRKNNEEFFAENYSYYVTKPSKLYQTNKSMYNFLKNDVFGGMEYSDYRFDATVK